MSAPVDRAEATARQHLRIAEGLTLAGRADDARGQALIAADAAARGLCDDPACASLWRWTATALWHAGRMTEAARAAARVAPWSGPPASVVVAVLDRPAGDPHSIDGLLADLAAFAGEVIVVFNDPVLGQALKDHPRIDKSAILSANAGVARAWNIGINLAEGPVVHILNADLRLDATLLDDLARALGALPDAAAVGVAGEVIDLEDFRVVERYLPGGFSAAAPVDKVSGYCFALHAGRCHDAGIAFDPRLAPYFYEELDLALKARAAGLTVYAVPADPARFDHGIGISRADRPIHLFGRLADRAAVLARNAGMIQARWRAAPTKTSRDAKAD